jgi:hypothetical protein
VPHLGGALAGRARRVQLARAYSWMLRYIPKNGSSMS